MDRISSQTSSYARETAQNTLKKYEEFRNSRLEERKDIEERRAGAEKERDNVAGKALGWLFNPPGTSYSWQYTLSDVREFFQKEGTVLSCGLDEIKTAKESTELDKALAALGESVMTGDYLYEQPNIEGSSYMSSVFQSPLSGPFASIIADTAERYGLKKDGLEIISQSQSVPQDKKALAEYALGLDFDSSDNGQYPTAYGIVFENIKASSNIPFSALIADTALKIHKKIDVSSELARSNARIEILEDATKAISWSDIASKEEKDMANQCLEESKKAEFDHFTSPDEMTFEHNTRAELIINF